MYEYRATDRRPDRSSNSKFYHWTAVNLSFIWKVGSGIDLDIKLRSSFTKTTYRFSAARLITTLPLARRRKSHQIPHWSFSGHVCRIWILSRRLLCGPRPCSDCYRRASIQWPGIICLSGACQRALHIRAHAFTSERTRIPGRAKC